MVKDCKVQVESMLILEGGAVLHGRVVSGRLRTETYLVTEEADDGNHDMKRDIHYSINNIVAYGHSFACLEEGMTAEIHFTIDGQRKVKTDLLSTLPTTLLLSIIHTITPPKSKAPPNPINP